MTTFWKVSSLVTTKLSKPGILKNVIQYSTISGPEPSSIHSRQASCLARGHRGEEGASSRTHHDSVIVAHYRQCSEGKISGFSNCDFQTSRILTWNLVKMQIPRPRPGLSKVTSVSNTQRTGICILLFVLRTSWALQVMLATLSRKTQLRCLSFGLLHLSSH